VTDKKSLPDGGDSSVTFAPVDATHAAGGAPAFSTSPSGTAVVDEAGAPEEDDDALRDDDDAPAVAVAGFSDPEPPQDVEAAMSASTRTDHRRGIRRT
jgi:hypothetical protein